MQSLVIFSCLIVATLAVTPFFESPHNEKASVFYKKPSGHSAPVFNPAPVYKPVPASVYSPAPAPVHKPAPVPVYNPAPAPAYNSAPVPVYKPAPAPVYKPGPAPVYKPAPVPAYKTPEYKTDYGNGATSYQKVNLEVGEPSYKPTY